MNYVKYLESKKNTTCFCPLRPGDDLRHPITLKLIANPVPGNGRSWSTAEEVNTSVLCTTIRWLGEHTNELLRNITILDQRHSFSTWRSQCGSQLDPDVPQSSPMKMFLDI